jgi:hypothetical protein
VPSRSILAGYEGVFRLAAEKRGENNMPTPSDSNKQSIHDTIRVNATERLSIVGFYVAIFIGVLSTIGNLSPINPSTPDTLNIATTHVVAGLFLTILGLIVFLILIKFNNIIFMREEFLKHLDGEWAFLKCLESDLESLLFGPQPGEKESVNEQDIKVLIRKAFSSIGNLLLIIMAFLISIGVYFVFSGLFVWFPLFFCIFLSSLISVLVFLLLFLYIIAERSDIKAKARKILPKMPKSSEPLDESIKAYLKKIKDWQSGKKIVVKSATTVSRTADIHPSQNA